MATTMSGHHLSDTVSPSVNGVIHHGLLKPSSKIAVSFGLDLAGASPIITTGQGPSRAEDACLMVSAGCTIQHLCGACCCT
jgi:hypothetical protein